ncbi:phosphotransferase [Terrabacter sp. Soil810]|uniref:phosphotransferase n=1 Tax=Terrabacter sp. Soil810 TaxID=1736418 RepID=UPI0007091B3B|nr:phosphotransferase [Terrabacter sp. Soil810]KRF40499.1 aminoglycoside phosphotransferase [Terrabacter sp. Soil810]
MTRSPLFLAALASSAVPGLDPVTVEGVPGEPGDLFEIAYVQDSQDRRWVVKAPCTAAAGAMLDDISALSGLLGRRLDVAMPMVRGLAQVPEGRAAVYLRVPGRPLDFSGLRPGPLTAEVGRTLAHIHNVEHLLFEEAGRPTYDAEAHRRRQLSELDRAAATGHVPTGLLTRWEHALEDVSLWRFAPCAVHGTFIGQNVLASFDDDGDSSSGHVRGVLAWEASRVGDAADDFAELARLAPAETLDAVLEAYAESRIERPDVHLVRRARLAAEMAPLRSLLHALASGQLDVVERTAEELRALDARVEEDDRRHAQEDAERSERTRQARERAAVLLDPDDPERPEPEWDATQPHAPFPMLGETQAISMTTLLDEPQEYVAGTAADCSAPSPEPVTGDVEEGPTWAHADDPEPEPSPWPEGAEEDSQPVPVMAADADASTFEIDEVEALPEDADGVLDLHEGASDFIAVEHRPEHPA